MGSGAELQLFGTDYDTPDGTCVRDYIHVVDLGEAHLSALTAAEPGTHHVINLGSGTRLLGARGADDGRRGDRA